LFTVFEVLTLSCSCAVSANVITPSLKPCANNCVPAQAANAAAVISVFFMFLSVFSVLSVLSCALFYPMRAPLWVPHFRMFYTKINPASTTFTTFFVFLFMYFCRPIRAPVGLI
jgi:hypothetical protein